MSKTPRNQVVTVCFHGIGEPQRALEVGEERFWVTTRQFSNLLSVLNDHPQVDITFDDSNASDYETAFTHLTRRDRTATFFIIAGRINKHGSLDDRQIKDISRAGMTIGTHGMQHVPWRTLCTQDERNREFIQAKCRIEDIVERPVRQASCPNGSYDRHVLHQLRWAGYERVYAVNGGASPAHSWLRDRYTITCHDTAQTLANYLSAPMGDFRTRLAHSARRLVKQWR